MDVDNELPDGHQGEVDLEQSLLQQFSCLGTTDKEELVKQLQRLLGSQLNESAASFFLDMNNWNLQAAICSYFDIEAPFKLPSMAASPSADAQNVDANAKFTKTWQIYNNGADRWPVGCVVQFAGGDKVLLASEIRIPVNCLAPGECQSITVEFTSPDKSGIYQNKYRMCTSSGSYFGDPLWVIATVVEEGTIALSEQLSHLSELGSPPTVPIPVNPFGQPRPIGPFGPNTESTDTDTNMC